MFSQIKLHKAVLKVKIKNKSELQRQAPQNNQFHLKNMTAKIHFMVELPCMTWPQLELIMKQ